MPRTDVFGNIIPTPTIDISDSWAYLDAKSLQSTKQERLNKRTAEKAAKLSMSRDVLLGMKDADTAVTNNLGEVRLSTPAAGYNYDAIESDHITRILRGDGRYVEAPTADPLQEIQASRYKQTVQPDAVARILNKPVTELTRQDYIDVANQQQIQALSDMINGNNYWKAPLIRGVTSTNLTGKYVDEFGNKVDIPLNIPITSAAFDKGVYGRSVASLGSIGGTNTTELEVNDPTQNAYTNIPNATNSEDMPPEEFYKAFIGDEEQNQDTSWYKDLISGVVKGFTSGEMEAVNLVEDLGMATIKAKGEGFLTNKDIDNISTSAAEKFGYNKEAVRADMEKQEKLAEETFKGTYDPTKWDYYKMLDLIGHSFSSFSMTGNSIGAIGAAILGGGEIKLIGKGLGKVILKKTTQETIKKSAKSRATIDAIKTKLKDKTLSNADKFALKKELVKNKKNLTALEAVSNSAKKMSMPLAYGMAITEQDLAELRRNGEEITPQRIITSTIANSLAIAVPELAIAKFQLGFLTDSAGKALKGSNIKSRAIDAFKGIVTAYGTSVGFEVPQEMLQQGVQALNQKWGTKAYEGKSPLYIISEEANNILSAGTAAVGMSSHMMTPGAITKVAKVPFGAKINDKFKQDRKNKKAIIEEAIKANPDIDPEVIKKAVKNTNNTGGDSLATPTSNDLKSTPITPTDIDKEAQAAVIRQLHNTEGKVETVEEIAPVEGEQEQVLKGALKQFDNVYEDALNRLTKPINDIVTANTILEEAGLPIDKTKNKQYTESVAKGSKDFIQYIVKAKEEAIKQGAGPYQIAAMDAKIERLIPLSTASNVNELHSILTDTKVTNSEKVRNVLGSSAASLADVEDALQLEGITENEKKLLKFKANVLKNYREVAGEKLLGTGSKPGAIQWATMLIEGIKDNKAIENLNNFIEGQYAKLKVFKDEVARWDRENNMPWTVKGHKDYNKYSEDPKAMKSTKRLYRSEYLKINKAKDDAVVRYGNTTIRGIASIDGLLDTLKTEHTSMIDLKELADSFSTSASSSPSNINVNTETVKEDVNKKASNTGSIDARRYSIAVDIANDIGIASNDVAFYNKNKEAINKLVNNVKEVANVKATETSPEAHRGTYKAETKSTNTNTSKTSKSSSRASIKDVGAKNNSNKLTNADTIDTNSIILENLKPVDQKWIKALRDRVAKGHTISKDSKEKFIRLKEESNKSSNSNNEHADDVQTEKEIIKEPTDTNSEKDLAKSKYEDYTNDGVSEEEAMFKAEFKSVLKDLEAFMSKKEIADTVQYLKEKGLVGNKLLSAVIYKLTTLEGEHSKQSTTSVKPQDMLEETKEDVATIDNQEATTEEDSNTEVETEKQQISNIDTMKSLNSERDAIISKLKTAPVGIRRIIMDNLSKCSGV